MSYSDIFSLWKSPWDFPNGVRTRSQEKKQKKITTKKFIKCFQNIENIQQWFTADDSEIEILNEDDRFYIIEQFFLDGKKDKKSLIIQ